MELSKKVKKQIPAPPLNKIMGNTQKPSGFRVFNENCKTFMISDWKKILDYITDNFDIRYDDFNKDEYCAYRERNIVGFVRFDKEEIFFDQAINAKIEELTWAHEALSIYYYHILKQIKHDDEIEEEAKKLCQDKEFTSLLRQYIDKARSNLFPYS